MLEVGHGNIKIITITIFHIFKELNGDMGYKTDLN